MEAMSSTEVCALEPMPDRAAVSRAEYGTGRSSIEFLTALMLSVVIFRLFVAEAYIVPTGSMAPTLMGLHRELTCSNCKKSFAVGMDEQGRSGRPLCPNCGARPSTPLSRSIATAIACSSKNIFSIGESRDGGKSRSSKIRATRRKRMSSGSSACRENPFGSMTATSISTAGSPKKTWPSNARRGNLFSTTITSRPIPIVIRVFDSTPAIALSPARAVARGRVAILARSGYRRGRSNRLD